MSTEKRKGDVAVSPISRDDKRQNRAVGSPPRSPVISLVTDLKGVKEVSHPSVMLATALETPDPNIKNEYLFQLFSKLNDRVDSHDSEIQRLKAELIVKDTTISNLKADQNCLCADIDRRLNVLHEEIEGLRQTQNTVEFDIGDGEVLPALGADTGFLRHAQRELPLLSDGLATTEGNIEQIKQDLLQLSGGLKEMDQKMKKHVRLWHLESDQSVQYSMRDSVRVTGVPFKQGENTNQLMCRIACSIGVNISETDISVSHRSGRRGGSTPRPIIVKFARRDTKHQILNNKKFTRDITTDDDGNSVKIFIDEHLTSMRASFCRKLRQDKVPHYTRDGKIHINVGEQGDNWKVLDTPDDWEKLDIPVKVKQEIGIFPKY